MNPFNFAATPHIHFGIGVRAKLAGLVAGYGSRLLLVTGGRSFDDSPLCQALLTELDERFELTRVRVMGEPTPMLVDQAVAACADARPDCVVAIGGGSPVDAAKAIAGLIPSGDSVMEYLEGVGRGKAYAGPATPFIAVPTTAGTGGETSKNAVLSVIGPEGYKKSFRDEQLVPRHIILDPELTLSCPPRVTAACGMDAFTQLLESYVSRNASPMTDALAESGMARAARALSRAVADGTDLDARSDMLYASSLSGLTLANAGLASVHALASPIGAFFPMPHGEVCGSLLHDASRINIELMEAREPANPALARYAAAGRIVAQNPNLDEAAARSALLQLLADWCERFAMPTLSEYGIAETDIDRLFDNASPGSMKTNPIAMDRDDIARLIRARL